MKLKVLFVALLLSFCNSSFACGLIESLFTSENVSLEFVGKIEIKTPMKNERNIQVPISIEGGKWLENSAIGLGKINAKIEGGKVYITVFTCVGGTKNLFKGFTIKNAKSGEYEVFYKNPDNSIVSIGTIRI